MPKGIPKAGKRKVKNNKGWFKEGILSTPKPFKKGHQPWNKGTKGLCKINSSSFKKGQYIKEKNTNWKGDDVGYQGVHAWVRRKKGRPKICEHCGKTTGKIEWANKDHKYRRNLADYFSLCVSCHKKYDRKQSVNNNRNSFNKT